MSARPYCRSCKAHRAAGEAHTADCPRAQNVRATSAGEQRGPVSSPAGRPLPAGELATPTTRT
jgi:hypothetical protein